MNELDFDPTTNGDLIWYDSEDWAYYKVTENGVQEIDPFADQHAASIDEDEGDSIYYRDSLSKQMQDKTEQYFDENVKLPF